MLTGSNSYNDAEVCESGLQVAGSCREYWVRDSKTNDQLRYPYACTVGSTCLYGTGETTT